MKRFILKNTSYQYLETAFGEWLDILGFAQGTVKSMPAIIREFLCHLEQNNVASINQLQHRHIKSYHGYINTRAHQREGGALSNNYINKHMQAIAKFLEYLHHKGVQGMPSIAIKLGKIERKEIEILATHEVKKLFELCNREHATDKETILQARDKAMLVIYYSCGLRKTEGASVSIDDIDFDARVLHVRKGKNYKERFVPFNKTNAAYLQEWIYDYRSQLVKGKAEPRLFTCMKGGPVDGDVLYRRFKLLQQQAVETSLAGKNVGLHALRHSIATHLLQAGMGLEKISRFLGHSSLASTQIYTHLISKGNE
ncbi:tyrosine-type recombinase/integrase [Parasediminibacterium sp. JCM 36343]|uniref:tyrosine-type recombinase/integrase n=1 Tax=Parasediminibacterium sp. JCM 36343 TaxID=3374279 RepID=UPI003977F6BA